VRLTPDDARARLERSDHGTLGTVHPERGVDLVPVVFACVDGTIAIPIDIVKDKSTVQLQRSKNLENDPRATLLVERWDRDDWSQLWWVRVEMRSIASSAETRQGLATRLVEVFEQYRDTRFADLLTFEIVSISGWSAS